ncbi:MAG: (4Fe-4S)-binding protein [Sphingobacteriales bacterium]
MEDIIKKYDNGEITVVWQPGKCIHSARCAKGLPVVFNPAQKPWINVGAADTKTIMHQIDQCPSGALSYIKNG